MATSFESPKLTILMFKFPAYCLPKFTKHIISSIFKFFYDCLASLGKNISEGESLSFWSWLTLKSQLFLIIVVTSCY